MTELVNLNQSPGKTVLNYLKTTYLRFLEGCGTQKFRMSNRRGNETGSFEVKIDNDVYDYDNKNIERET